MFNPFKKKEQSKPEPKNEVKKDIRPLITNIIELKKPCLFVEKNDNITLIIQSLKDTLEFYKGWGLSANQIGINKKISYVKIPTFVDKNTQVHYKEFVLINAKIIERDKPIKINNEECLSFRNIPTITKRYVFITVEYLNEKMEQQVQSLQDLEALIVQHEVDHQNGMILFDRKWRA